MGYAESTFRIACSFFVLLLLTRLMGKTEISQLNVFTFITAITIDNIASSLSTDKRVEIDKGVYSLLGWTFLTIAMGYLGMKSKKARHLITGEPKIVIKQGKVMEKALKQVRLDIESLLGMLRQQNVFSIKDVEYAILEINGNLSVMQKQDKKPNSWSKTLLFPTSTGVIYDGKANEDALKDLHVDNNWLHKQLEKAEVNSIDDVFYAEVQSDGSLYIDYKKDKFNS
ncbi:DUF421 domain-containing protein [Priestia sp. JV24]|uniref:DUF421 domain-containing protein n=1 Tax=Priestia TaxID=2800373 RepID=UPI0021D677F7|nr:MULTISPECIES: DUF421 domain-containing protein [Priestia]MCU7711637.1 DUF421 domain-containing protein [Priestia megaterium]MCW1046217.1 DUF421 domain-containing protein [Priestia sp. JV24]